MKFLKQSKLSINYFMYIDSRLLRKKSSKPLFRLMDLRQNDEKPYALNAQSAQYSSAHHVSFQ